MSTSSLVFVATFKRFPTPGLFTKTRPFWNVDDRAIHTEFARFAQEVYKEAGHGFIEFSVMPLED